MKKYKKPLLIALVVLDVAIIVFFLVLSIMILTAVTKYKAQAANNTEGLVKAILQMKPVEHQSIRTEGKNGFNGSPDVPSAICQKQKLSSVKQAVVQQESQYNFT